MRWFKHLSRAQDDPKLKLLLAKFGFEGYGVYWAILETIADNLNGGNETAVAMSEKQWRKSVEISPKNFQKIINFLSENLLISTEKAQNILTIRCPNIVKYRDEYTSRKK